MEAPRDNKITSTFDIGRGVVQGLTCQPFPFLSQGVFEAHMRRHRGEKPFKCPYCDKAFTLAMSRRHHITRFHTGDYHIFCPLCHKGIVSNKMLRRHLFHVHSTVLGGTSKRAKAAAAALLLDAATAVEGSDAVLAEEEEDVVELQGQQVIQGGIEAEDTLSVADDGTLTVTLTAETLPADALLLGAVESVQGVETVIETVQFQ